jgi:alpha-1,3-glucosyltransferase
MRLPTLTPHIAIQTFLLLSSIKWLLVPTYRSTDFDVHRLWLAITRHLPLDEWYYYDANGTTPHTLDYPPLFAFFEYALSNNFITSSLLKYGGDGSSSSSASSSWLDEECLALLPVPTSDTTMATATASSRILKVSDNCIRFHRGTVIISVVVLFVGAYMAATAVASTSTTMTTTPTPSEASVTSSITSKSSSWVAFILIVTNPGLLMLDHVHFQYNGMLLGVLLISISCIVRGASSSESFSSPQQQQQQQNHDETQTHRNRRQEQLWELLGAGTFASLLALKHLYLTLAPLYFFYLLRRHCFIIVNDEKNGKPKYDTANINTQSSDNIIMNSSGDGGSSSSNTILMRQREVLRFSWTRLLVLGFVAVLCFLGPFVPFMIQSNNPVEQTQQILKRLFPFGRGVSSYFLYFVCITLISPY